MAQINFNSIYTTYYRKAFLFTLSYVHNDLVAEDIVSEAIIHLWELSKEKEIPSIEAILITYIRSKSLNYLKHIQAQENVFQTLQHKGQRELEIRISTLEACDPKEILSGEFREKVNSLLASMPEKTRIAFIRDRLDGKSHKEIAEELGISVKGVEYHLTKAVRILRDNLKEYAPFLFFFI
ncbi:RNA polymerase sigma-70 factor [Bacteroides sp.]|uniref:RNA polymerase sigma-70 factor n=1 Tax=Bacteroides sp. TaxID=29523 RepID=UPI0025C2282A|nr:RNA polymerase sigma-70 factor [Bacteroides sp.]